MKRTCCSHKQAQFICISQKCKQKCAYLCSTPYDTCKQQHESCQLIAINYIVKKCNKIVSKEKSLKMNELQKIYDQCKRIVNRFESFFDERQNSLRIKDLLDPHGLFSEDEKSMLISFAKNDNKKLANNDEDSLTAPWIEKELIGLNIQVGSYLKLIREDKRVLEEEQVLVETGSLIKPQQKLYGSSMKKVQEKGSAIDKIRSQSKGPSTPYKSGSNSEIQSPPTRSSKVKKIVNPAMTMGSGFESRISAVIKGHNPVGPLFSKITNNVETLQAFFYEKFKGATLLYRASENDYLASKFHEKCDGHKNTLTILITQFDKIIGGFTPLPWRSNGDWYDDETEASFIFSLTEGQRFPITSKSRAIFCNQAYGPSFGYPDLQIANKAFYNQNSCVNFPQFYNNGNYTQSPASIQVLCGTKTGHFRIKEWQVYQLEF